MTMFTKKQAKKGVDINQLSSKQQANKILSLFKKQGTKLLNAYEKPENVGKADFSFFKQLNQITVTIKAPVFDSKLENLIPKCEIP